MTVLTSDGQQRPTSRRKAGNFAPASFVQNSVEDIAERMATLSVSHTEPLSDLNSESSPSYPQTATSSPPTDQGGPGSEFSQSSTQTATSSSPRSADQGGVGSDNIWPIMNL